jgi:hypothetical protein
MKLLPQTNETISLISESGPVRPWPESFASKTGEHKRYAYKKRQWKPPSKKEKGGKKPHMPINPRNKKACHSISAVLMQNVAKIGTQSIMKRSIKTLLEFSPQHIHQKTSKGNISRSTNEMLHADIVGVEMQ